MNKFCKYNFILYKCMYCLF